MYNRILHELSSIIDFYETSLGNVVRKPLVSLITFGNNERTILFITWILIGHGPGLDTVSMGFSLVTTQVILD